jgi:hypothetical protein
MIQYKYMEEEDHFTQTQLPALIAALTDAALGSPSFSLLFSLLCSLSLKPCSLSVPIYRQQWWLPTPALLQQWWLPTFNTWDGMLHLSMDDAVH